MTKTDAFPVTVKWTKRKLDRLPISGEYITVSKFPEDDLPGVLDRWSVKLVFSPPVQPSDGVEWNGTASFLVADAPWERLRPGVQFEMYEGRVMTATVTLLD